MRVSLIDINNKPVEKIYKAYRICYSGESWFNIKVPDDLNEMIAFIKPLMKELHTSPLEHVNVSFVIEGLSRSALAQLTRHRTFSFNVQSQRYVDGCKFEMVIPKLDYVKNKKLKEKLEESYGVVFESLSNQYRFLRENGVSKEDARAILPMNTGCQLVMTCDINNFRNFLRQRLCKSAQLEIREVAEEMVRLVKPYIPFVADDVLICGICGRCKNGKR